MHNVMIIYSKTISLQLFIDIHLNKKKDNTTSDIGQHNAVTLLAFILAIKYTVVQS